jgi:lipopolysaccharide/colanic/teichoic acid biosynthesis glycosyltransferase
VSFHVFPEDAASSDPGQRVDLSLYPDVVASMRARKRDRALKRAIDIAGSLLALIVCAPVLFAIAVLIKLTSPGPVLFRQIRLGQYGKRISFLKFRSMYSMNNDGIHQEYMKRYISGSADCAHGCVYKIKNDPRVTPLGRLLRRTSLDEFPQFFNVLLGDMSLVGPRPPIPYEFDAYDEWHKRRLLVKPGITGLWQVRGRSLTTFDEMVRMDLDYADSWSPWVDLKLLFQTPRAVLSGRGAF